MDTQHTAQQQDESTIDITCKTQSSEYFDEVIGHIEDIVLSEKFQELHDNFLEKYWSCIENTEENKLEYMDIFQEYTTTFESFFVKELTGRMKGFDMERFAIELDENNAFTDILNNGEIFELLYSFTNFQTFKELMLDYRSKMEGNVQHLDFDILVTRPVTYASTPSPQHVPEDDIVGDGPFTLSSETSFEVTN